jgi:hypothetical protein
MEGCRLGVHVGTMRNKLHMSVICGWVGGRGRVVYHRLEGAMSVPFIPRDRRHRPAIGYGPYEDIREQKRRSLSSPPQTTKLAQRPILDGPNATVQTEAILPKRVSARFYASLILFRDQ